MLHRVFSMFPGQVRALRACEMCAKTWGQHPLACVGVAGAAGDHYVLLIFGLVLSIILMATAANLISGWIKRYKWIAWAGLLAILVVAIELIYTDIKILFL